VGADWDRPDLSRRSATRTRALTAARGAGGVVVLVVALGILYLAFRGPSGHPTASVATTGGGGAVPVIASGKGAGNGASGIPAATTTGHPTSSAANPAATCRRKS